MRLATYKDSSRYVARLRPQYTAGFWWSSHPQTCILDYSDMSLSGFRLLVPGHLWHSLCTALAYNAYLKMCKEIVDSDQINNYVCFFIKKGYEGRRGNL